MTQLTHLNARGEVHMVDVGDKDHTLRIAIAGGQIRMSAETLQVIETGAGKKGDVLATARLAGIMAAKKTADLIPLCHPVALNHVSVEFELQNDAQGARVICRVRTQTHYVTGVEMEALIGVQVALATIYDMCKSIDRAMVISDVCLLEKSGGRSGHYMASDDTARV